MAELVDALDSGSSEETLAGSSPVADTNNKRCRIQTVASFFSAKYTTKLVGYNIIVFS